MGGEEWHPLPRFLSSPGRVTILFFNIVYLRKSRLCCRALRKSVFFCFFSNIPRAEFGELMQKQHRWESNPRVFYFTNAKRLLLSGPLIVGANGQPIVQIATAQPCRTLPCYRNHPDQLC